MAVWNPWHGCRKISPGCQNCYVYRRDAAVGIDSSVVRQTAQFSLPVRRKRNGAYCLTDTSGPVYTCMTSDFFLEETDIWRREAWAMIRQRRDLHFVIITKRIHRFFVELPDDWGDGYDNVTLICTCEDQEQADQRLPIFLKAPIIHREIIHEPMLEEIHIEPYLASGGIERVTCGGESGEGARVCRYDWILQTREQCIRYGVGFHFKQTGGCFQKDGRLYRVERKFQMAQAQKAGIDVAPGRHAPPGCAPPPMEGLFCRLAASPFRSRFRLGETEKKYLEEKGMDVIQRHAADFVRERLAPAHPRNDGAQTPMRGHPVFLAQHATGCCCRGCLQKWHGIHQGRRLTRPEQDYVVSILLEWIHRQSR